MSDSSDLDDFQPVNFQDNLQKCMASVDIIRSTYNPRKKRKKDENKKRGPKRRTAPISPYFLPPGSPLPQFKPSGKLTIEAHVAAGYGYANGSPPGEGKVGDKPPKKPVAYEMSLEDFKEIVWGWFPKLVGKNFNLYSTGRGNKKKLMKIDPPVPKTIRDKNYQGVTFIQEVETEEPPHPVAMEQVAAQIDPVPMEQVAAEKDDMRNDNELPDLFEVPATSASVSLRPSAVARAVHVPRERPPIRPRLILHRQSEFNVNNNTHSDHVLSAPTTSTPIAASRPTGTSTHVAASTSTSTPVAASVHESVQPVSQVSMVDAKVGPDEEMDDTVILNEQAQTHTNAPGSNANIRAIQDLEYLQSSTFDQQQARERRAARIRFAMARSERKRRRAAMQEERVQAKSDKLKLLGDEPPDGFLITFRTTEDNLKRRFLSTDKVMNLFHFVEGASIHDRCKLHLAGAEIERSQLSLSEIDITSNASLMVEDMDLKEDSDEEEEKEEESVESSDDGSSNPKQAKNKDLDDVRQRAMELKTFLGPEKKIYVTREKILDLMDYYERDPDLVHHRLAVVFKGEEVAEDLDGVTREMFTVFLREALKTHFEGQIEKVPVSDHQINETSTLTTIGKIVAHAFVITGYFPTSLSKASLACLYNGIEVVGDETFLESFLRYIPEDQAKFISEVLLNPEMLHEDKHTNTAIAILGGTCCRIRPTATNFSSSITSVAKSEMFFNILWPLTLLKQGLQCYPYMWDGIPPRTWHALYESLRATPERVLALVDVDYSDVTVLYTMEYRSFSFFEKYVRSLNQAQLKKLLIFWSSADCLLERLKVDFNSVSGELLRPLVNTCLCTLHLSRQYMCYEELCKNFNTYIMNRNAEKFDTH